MTDNSFLAPPGELLDWRRVVLTNLAVRSGIVDALPGRPDDIADRLDLDTQSVRVLLEALAVWDIVTADTVDGFVAGANAPDADDRHQLRQHARFIGRWVDELPARLPDHRRREPVPHDPRALAGWLHSLGAGARRQAPKIIDRCLEQFPDAARVLDLAGGHGEYGIEAARRGLDVTLLDVPAVIDVVTEWPSVIESGVALRAADAFTDELGGPYDLVLCFGFTHTLPGERMAGLFPRLAEVTAPGGGIAINTFLRGEDDVARLFAVQMLVAGNGGDTHRLDDYRAWLTAAGFDEPEVSGDIRRSLLISRRR